jgi:predicted nucleic acid-binding protein
MGLIRTYLDAGILIAAARSATRLSESALTILDDASREFVASEYLNLEVLPKAYYHRSLAEAALYEEFFSSAVTMVPFGAVHFEPAMQYARQFGLSAFDSLHLTAAIMSKCEEFITSENALRQSFASEA